jgi:hypothetical protein
MNLTPAIATPMTAAPGAHATGPIALLWNWLPSAEFVGRVLAGTPSWVWGLLAGLVVLGGLQTRDRTAGLARIVTLPLALMAFSLWGLVSAFGAAPGGIAAWLVAAAIVVFGFSRLDAPQGTSYDAATRRFHLRGSWVPMLLILGIFFTRYVVNVGIAIHPELKAHGDFAFAVAALYGALSGIFAGRTLRLARMAASPAALVPAA